VKIGVNNLEVPDKFLKTQINLEFQKKFIMTTAEPFNFRYSFWKPSHFYTGLEAHSLTHSYRTFRFNTQTYTAIDAYQTDNLLNIDIYANKKLLPIEIDTLYSHIIYSYGLLEINKLSCKIIAKNKQIKEIIKKFIGTRISCPETLFEISVVSLLLQNTTISRTTTMFRKLIEDYGSVVKFRNIALFSFYSPDDLFEVTETKLKKNCRLGYRAKYIINYAKFFVLNHELDLRKLDKQALLEKLQTIKGVGPYTSNVVASHALRDKKIIPLDSWNRKILSETIYNTAMLDKEELRQLLIDDFGDYAGLIALYVIENEYIDNPVVKLIDELY
jgi:endonuclease III